LHICNTITKGIEILPESIPKKLSAPPQQAFPINITSSNNLVTRCELPAGNIHYLKWLEVSYDMQLVVSATNAPLVGADGGDFNYVLPAKLLSEFMTFEMYPNNSTIKLSYISQADYYSAMSSLAYLDCNKRDISQRLVFRSDRTDISGATMNISDPPLEIIDKNVNAAISKLDATSFSPANWISLKQRGIAAPKYKFCYRLSDAYQDSYINEDTGTYTASNIICIFSWNNLSRMIAQVGTGDGAASTTILQAFNNNTYSLKIDNFKLNYYIESNPKLTELMKAQDYTLLTPYIIQNNTSQTGIQNGCTLYTDVEPGNRLYKVYASLFANVFSSSAGNAANQNGWVAQNNTNVDRGYPGLPNDALHLGTPSYEKWSKIELYIQNDLLATYDLGNYNEYKAYLLNKFKNSSFDSKITIENFGTFIYLFDTDKYSGRKDEYDKRQLKGMMIGDRQININPRFTDVRAMDGVDNLGAINFNATRSYTNQVFGVILRRLRNNKGNFSYE